MRAAQLLAARRALSAAAPLALALVLTSCFMFTRERDLAGVWRGEFVLAGEVFPAALELRGVDGRLEGPLTGAATNARVTIFLEGEEVSLSGSYREQGCSGVLRGTGRVEEDGTLMQGELTAEDSCTGVSTGTFRLALMP